MKQALDQELCIENAMGFINRRLLPALHQLSVLNSLDSDGRLTILTVAASLALLPEIDSSRFIKVEVDLNWDDRNWIGTLDIKNSSIELFTTFCQVEGLESELCAQWQHTAFKLSVDDNVVVHDAAHLWFWIDCFQRAVDAGFNAKKETNVYLKFITNSSDLELVFGKNQVTTESV